MSYRALVVSTWGDFRRYQPAYYVHEGGGAGVKCNSSSIALTQILSARGHDVKALVILPYTLLGPEDIGNAGSIDYPVVVDRVVGKAREQVKQWVGSGDCEAGDAINRLEFAVVPAMASIIDTKLKFEAKPNLYQLAVYHSVYRALTSGDYDWVYLDTTHGINYMPHLASEAVRLAVHVYAVRRGRPIEYVTVNSDPYPQRERPTAKPQGQSEVPNLTIYETYHETATPQGAPGVVGALSLDILKWYVRTTSRNNRGELHVDEEALRLGLILGVSLRDALYPVMLSLGDEIGRYRDVVVSDLGRLDTAPVGVRRDGDWTVVAHTYEPSILRSSGGIMYRAAMAMHALLEVAHKLVEDVRGEVMVVNGSVALTIDALRRLNNAYGNITNRAIVENEIAKLQYVENDVNRDFMSKHVGRQYRLMIFEAHPYDQLWTRCVRNEVSACKTLDDLLNAIDRGGEPLEISGISTKYDLCRIAAGDSDEAVIDKYRDLISHVGLDMYNTYVIITEEGGKRKPLITYGDKINCLKDLIHRSIMIEITG